MSLEDRKKHMGRDPEAEKIRQARIEKGVSTFKAQVNAVLSTEAGKAVFIYLADRCGFIKPTVSIDGNGNVATGNMVFNEARRELYLELRAFASPELLKKIEYLEESK